MMEHNSKHQIPENISKNNKAECETEIKREVLSPTHTNNSNSNVTPVSTSLSPETGNCKPTNVVKASGTFYPLCGLTNTRSSSPPCNNEEKVKSESPLHTDSALVTSASIGTSPLLNLLPDWLQADTHVRYTTEKPCCRAFCKLKRKDHYHCNACNQAFSEIDKLKQHVIKHNASAISPFISKQESNNNNNITEDGEDIRHSPVIPTSLSVGMESHYQTNFGVAMAAAQQFAMMTSQGISFIPHGMPALYTSQSGLMFTAPHAFTHHPSLIGNGLLDSVPSHVANITSESSSNDLSTRRSSSPQHEMSPEMKKARIQTSMRILKDEPVPEGYLRFRFNEDCHYNHCGYREHQTHFHCIRQDCGYSFCDKTRFVQHTARHERLDTLMGGDFQQYRANVSCGRNDCAYAVSLGSSQNKASHFHCLKCEFVCTDTNKVVAHRRQHQKSDSIMAAGFEKFTPSQACRQPDSCVHSGKQTHYHCLSCQYAVLGLSQMTAHKYRHMD
ncbi:hypothetical protein PGB90_009853 [Kerria lacca]